MGTSMPDDRSLVAYSPLALPGHALTLQIVKVAEARGWFWKRPVASTAIIADSSIKIKILERVVIHKGEA